MFALPSNYWQLRRSMAAREFVFKTKARRGVVSETPGPNLSVTCLEFYYSLPFYAGLWGGARLLLDAIGVAFLTVRAPH